MTDDLKRLMDIEVRKLTLEPGDALVFSLDGDTWKTMPNHDFKELAGDIKAHVSEQWGFKVPVMVLGPGVEITQVRETVQARQAAAEQA